MGGECRSSLLGPGYSPWQLASDTVALCECEGRDRGRTAPGLLLLLSGRLQTAVTEAD